MKIELTKAQAILLKHLLQMCIARKSKATPVAKRILAKLQGFDEVTVQDIKISGTEV